MLRRGDPQQRITRMLTNLERNNRIRKGHSGEYLSLLLANINAVVDPDPILAPSRQRLVLSYGELLSLHAMPEGVRAVRSALELRMQRYRDPDSRSYRP